MVRVVIGLLCSQNEESQRRKELCRETWIPAVRALGFDVVFLIGGYDTRLRDGDELHLPVFDGYRNLPQKTRWFCEWAVEMEYDRVFKADDDTFIHPPRFARFMDDHSEDDYVGVEWRPRCKYASGGAGYVLSRKAMELVAAELTVKRGYEDVIVGRIMETHHIPFAKDCRLVPFGSESRRPLPENDLVTAHKFPADLWRDCWDSFSSAE